MLKHPVPRLRRHRPMANEAITLLALIIPQLQDDNGAFIGGDGGGGGDARGRGLRLTIEDVRTTRCLYEP